MFKKLLFFYAIFFIIIVGNCYGISLICDPVPASSGVTNYELSINGDIVPGNLENLPESMVRLNHDLGILDIGEYTVSARAGDDLGNISDWSNEVSWKVEMPFIGNLTVVVSENMQLEISDIIDNRDAETSQIGDWGVSGGADPYGEDSVWSRNGATFTWHITTSKSGFYEVSMRWTAWPSRGLNIPVDIGHSDGVTTVYVDQQKNGSKWNVQGQYYFESGITYDITIISQPGPSSTCADAIKYKYVYK